MFTTSGDFLREWGASGGGDGQFDRPLGIAVDEAGNVYVADTANNRVQVFSSTGEFRQTWGSRGSGDGQFIGPRGIEVDRVGYVYVADTANDRVQVFSSTGDSCVSGVAVAPATASSADLRQ